MSDAAERAEDAGEFERFADFARKVVSVRKDELDEAPDPEENESDL